jgi:DNA repair protein RecN (Recombination protein N)
MLRLLQLKELAIVDAIELEFEAGLTVITGETGAGKSILLDGLDLALGARANRHVVRQGAASAHVAALFWPPGGGEVLLEREVSMEGRSFSRIDGRVAPAQEVRTLGDSLVELLAQGEAATLLRPRRQRELLDRFAGSLDLYRAALALRQRIAELEAARAEAGGDPRQRARQIDLLRHEVAEIDGARIVVGELEALEQEVDLLSRREDILAALQDAHAAVRSEQGGAAEDLVGQAMARLRPLQRFDRRIEEIANMLSDAAALLGEVAAAATAAVERLEYDPQALRRLEERRALIEALRRKYGESEAEILRYRESASAELERLASWEEEAEKLGAEIRDLELRLAEQRQALLARRVEGAATLERALLPELERLALGQAELKVLVHDTLDDEAIRFDFTPNPGETPRPLGQSASGGEASRVLLAIGSVLARDEDATLVLDEVDQGLGGRAARSLAQHLRELARHRQVIAVSHQAVVAARADRHIGLSKEVVQGRTIVRAQILTDDARIAEIARMLAGESGDAALRHARELLAAD